MTGLPLWHWLLLCARRPDPMLARAVAQGCFNLRVLEHWR